MEFVRYSVPRSDRGSADDSIPVLRRKRSHLVAEMRRVAMARSQRQQELRRLVISADSAAEAAAIRRRVSRSTSWMSAYIDDIRAALQYISYLIAHDA